MAKTIREELKDSYLAAGEIFDLSGLVLEPAPTDE